MDHLQAFHRLSTQIRILYDQSVVTFLFPIIAAPAVCWLLWHIADRTQLLIWTVVVISYSLARYLIIWQQGKTKTTPENANKWLDIFTASVFISGLLWGSASIVLVPYAPHRLMEFTLYNSLTMLIVCGLVAGAIVSYAVCRRVIVFYAFPALVPPALYLMILGDRYNSFLGGFVFLYFMFVLVISFRLNRQFISWIDLEFQLLQLSRKYRDQSEKQSRD